MIDISGHIQTTRNEVGCEVASSGLIVNCCGYQKFTEEDVSIHRTTGRLDYQLIYIHKGSMQLYTNKWEYIPCGSIVIYRPYEPQFYRYLAKDQPEVYWIHFTGYQSESLLTRISAHSLFIGQTTLLPILFTQIIQELQLKKPLFETIVIHDFYKLIASIERMQLLQPCTTPLHTTVDKLILTLHQDYMHDWNVSLMASFCNLSDTYFAHLFKDATGIPPLQFLTQLRIEKAKELLIAENLPLSTIATLVGYKDPLYFSKVFKNNVGMAPKQYRKQHLALNTPFKTL